MKTSVWRTLSIPLIVATAAVLGCGDQPDLVSPGEAGSAIELAAAEAPGGGGKPGPETAGNNLSYPVIWADGVAKDLPGTPGMIPVLDGVWWYQWGTNGTDPNVTPASCPPDPDEGNPDLNPGGLNLCDDGVAGAVDTGLVAGTPVADTPLALARAYLQKDLGNQWQAESWPAPVATPVDPVIVDLIDWGDNLESVDWTTRSMVRTEVVLFEDAVAGDEELDYGWNMLEYEMRHTSGWGINEAHGLAATLDGPVALLGPGTRATVYTHCARLTIQRVLVDRDDPALAGLEWVAGEGWTEPEGEVEDLIAPALFNGAVHQGGDGPGYYSAEINVKGRIIFGYTWNVKKLNEGPGIYRLTFSLDELCGTVSRNTAFEDGVTEILAPIEEEEAATEAEPDADTGGATGVLRADLNLTYMDVNIVKRSSGGGGG